MASQPQLTRGDREMRRERLLRSYAAGASSRAVALRFGLSSGYVRAVVRDAGLARRVGAPEMAAFHVGPAGAGAITGSPA